MNASKRRSPPTGATGDLDGGAAAAFERIRKRHLSSPGVEAARMFGSDGMKVNGKVFAMLVKDALVVKLHADRAASLVVAGLAAPFDPGHGRIMKEWIALAARQDLWGDFISEAKAFVSQAGKTVRGKK